MRSSLRFILSLTLSLLLFGCGQDATHTENTMEKAGPTMPTQIAPSETGGERHFLGEYFPNAELKGVDGRTFSWAEYSGGKPLLISIRDVTCPICKRYGPILKSYEEKLAAKGVKLVYVNPMLHDDVATMKDEIATYRLEGLYVDDRDQRIARALKARSTAEVFLFNAERKLVYRGAIDDSQGIGYVNNARKTYLDDAIEAVLSGRDIKIDSTTAPGCMLDLDAPVTANNKVTFHDQISRIMQKRCQRCHREGENAPFSLVSYQDIAGRKGMIKYVLRKNLMPPWYASDEHGGPWTDDLRIPEAEKQTVLDWIKADCPEGDRANAPTAIPWAQGWKIGTPDAVLQVKKKLRVPEKGLIPYKYVVVETNFEEDKWIEALELRSEQPEAIHHILVFYYMKKHEAVNAKFLGHLALQGYFAIFSPGVEPIVYPKDRGKLLKKGQKLLFQVHYNSVGKELWDQPSIGFKFRKTPPKHSILCSAASTDQIHIKPNATNHKVTAEYRIPTKARIFGYTPHMHARGSKFSMDLIYPDGKTQRVLWVPSFNFNWQQSFRLRDPFDVPAGTVVRATGWFDNSDANPANPDPSQDVYFGLQTIDEMMIGYFEWMKLE
ncbi:MAG: thiol-disulfide isomerase/thioredoxin [Planctomycetota bacterium]|jgi:thiol-disulfide isomerase/thioredoxin